MASTSVCDGKKTKTSVKLEDESKLGGPVFNPPLYKQRYNEVINIARNMKAKKIVDMGCAECKLLRILKQEPYVEQLFGVDFDSIPLRINESIVRPLTTDYLLPRDNPLHFTLFQGSIAVPDSRLMNFDLLSCVEVIEHLDPDVLDNVPSAVFGILCPKVVVMTTPNSEFNILFPGFSGFRHYDHRFEWSRAEFESWCTQITHDYAYTVVFGGVGAPPESKEDLGCCSQMATFTRKDGYSFVATSDVGTPYTTVASANHPFISNPVTPKQKLCTEAEYYLNILLQTAREQWINSDHYFDTNECELEVPPDNNRRDDGDSRMRIMENTVYIRLDQLLKFPKIRALCSSEEEIRDALQLSSLVQLEGNHAVYPVAAAESDSDSDCEETGEFPCVKNNEHSDIMEEHCAIENW